MLEAEMVEVKHESGMLNWSHAFKTALEAQLGRMLKALADSSRFMNKHQQKILLAEGKRLMGR